MGKVDHAHAKDSHNNSNVNNNVNKSALGPGTPTASAIESQQRDRVAGMVDLAKQAALPKVSDLPHGAAKVEVDVHMEKKKPQRAENLPSGQELERRGQTITNEIAQKAMDTASQTLQAAGVAVGATAGTIEAVGQVAASKTGSALGTASGAINSTQRFLWNTVNQILGFILAVLLAGATWVHRRASYAAGMTVGFADVFLGTFSACEEYEDGKNSIKYQQDREETHGKRPTGREHVHGDEVVQDQRTRRPQPLQPYRDIFASSYNKSKEDTEKKADQGVAKAKQFVEGIRGPDGAAFVREEGSRLSEIGGDLQQAAYKASHAAVARTVGATDWALEQRHGNDNKEGAGAVQVVTGESNATGEKPVVEKVEAPSTKSNAKSNNKNHG